MADRAYIFDCDGVLVNSEELVIAIERRFLANLGLVYTDTEFLTRFVGTSDKDFLALLQADHADRGTGHFPADFMEQVRQECWHTFTHALRAIEGVTTLLAAIDAPKGVASSSTVRSLDRKLSLTDLAPWFGEHIYSSEHVENGKPAPDLFLFAAERLEVSPSQCVVIEDSVNGVRAGVAAGMEVWGFTGGGHCDASVAPRLSQAGAARVFAAFSDIHAAIR